MTLLVISFDYLPDEILNNILSYMSYRTILEINEISIKLNEFCKRNLDELLRQYLKITRINTSNYTRYQLINLCKNSSKIQNISAGGSHSLILKDNGQVYAFGVNCYGQLGLGNNCDKRTPTLIQNINNIVQISAGVLHSLILMETGQIYSFGRNDNGQLGLGDYNDKNDPVLISKLDNIIQISAGGSHSIVLDNNGKVYSFGINNCGQLGLGNFGSKNVPTLIERLNNIIQVSTGCGLSISSHSGHSLTLSNNGQIYVFGYNNYGQLGLGDYRHRCVPTLINNFNRLLGNDDIIQMSLGGDQSLIFINNIKSNEQHIYSFGYNKYGQLGLGDTKNRNFPTLIDNIGHNINSITTSNYQSIIL